MRINIYEYSDKGELHTNSANLDPVVNGELIAVILDNNPKAFAVVKGTPAHERVDAIIERQFAVWKVQDKIAHDALMAWVDITNDLEEVA